MWWQDLEDQAEASFAAERKRVKNLTKNLQKLQDDTEIALQNERQTVSLFVTEKAHLKNEPILNLSIASKPLQLFIKISI